MHNISCRGFPPANINMTTSIFHPTGTQQSSTSQHDTPAILSPGVHYFRPRAVPTQGTTSPEKYNEQVFIGENPWKMLQSPSVSDIHVGIGVILLWRWRRATASAHETSYLLYTTDSIESSRQRYCRCFNNNNIIDSR